MSHVFSAIAEFEFDVIRERTRLGVATARDRPNALTATKLADAIARRDTLGKSLPGIAKRLNISVATLYRHMPPRPSLSRP